MLVRKHKDLYVVKYHKLPQAPYNLTFPFWCQSTFHSLNPFVGNISIVFLLLYVWGREFPNVHINIHIWSCDS